MLTLTSPVRTWAHSLPAGAKLAALSLVTAGLFWLTSPSALAMALLAVLALTASGGGRFLRAALRMLLPLWPFLLVVGVWHLWLDQAAQGAAILMRMLAAVAAANFVTMTTRLSDMLTVLEWLCRPLAPLGLRPRSLALAVTLVIRFIPTLMRHAEAIGHAWRARSPRRAGVRVIVPLTLAALDDATRSAEALRARGGVE